MSLAKIIGRSDLKAHPTFLRCLKWLDRNYASLLLLAVMLAVGGARISLIRRCGSDVPWGDQWYGEVARTYSPWLRGDFHFTDLFGAHNEHRIVATRILDILLLELNGQWDPRMQQVVNTLIILAALFVLFRQVALTFSASKALIAAGVISTLWSSDYLWENTLCGFQSQFYFLLLFSLIHVFQTTSAKPFSTAWWIGHAAGLCNLFTMAAGPISACAILGWLLWCRLRARESAPGDLFVLVWNCSLLAFGCWLLPYSPTIGHVGPSMPVDRIRAFLYCLSWPVLKWQIGIVIWAPALIYVGRAIIRPSSRAIQGGLVALVIISALFALATALARDGIPSRYGDILALGILANLLCLIAWPNQKQHGSRILIFGAIWLFVILLGLRRQEEEAFEITLQHETVMQWERANDIRRYLLDGDASSLRKNGHFSELDIGVIQNIRETPALREILPFSVRYPLNIEFINGNEGFLIDGAPKLENEVTALPIYGTWSSYRRSKSASSTSSGLSANKALVSFLIAGNGSSAEQEFFLQLEDGSRLDPLQRPTARPDRWRQINFLNPCRSFKIVASVKKDGDWFAFSAPREYARGSWLTTKVLSWGSVLCFGGWILLGTVAVGVLGARCTVLRPH